MRLILVFFAVTFTATSVLAIQEEPEKSPPVATGEPKAPTKLDINPAAEDQEIARRLESILDSTGWFEDAVVNVDNGVVRLEGTAESQQYSDWAETLAGNTQDVTAVVNLMKVRPRSLWDLSPAFGELNQFRRASIQSLPFVVFGFLVFLVTLALAGVARFVARHSLRSRMPNRLLRNVVANLIAIPVLIFGIYVILRVSGLTQLALTVLGGTGVAGLIVGIAFRDIAENFLASILISAQNPFRMDDFIEVAGHEGFVQQVTTRGTTLLTRDGNHVLIPNAVIYKETIINYTANPNRRIEFDVEIGYADSVTRAQEIVIAAIEEHPGVIAEPRPRVLLWSLGANNLVLRVYFWVNSREKDWQTVRSSLMRVVKRALQDHRISLPDGLQKVVFPQGVPAPGAATEDIPATDEQGDGRTDEPGTPSIREEPVTAAEGTLESDEGELRRQAENSWNPEEGENLLESG